MARVGEISRKTSETNIDIKLTLEGSGKTQLSTGNPFMDHMMHAFVKHGSFDLELKCIGDIEIDFHHSIEDIGICLGRAFSQALGDFRGINRYSSVFMPMDEALVRVCLDICGRSNLVYEVELRDRVINNFECDLVYDFFKALSDHAGLTLHIDLLRGRNSHHCVEGIFKGVGRAFREACAIDQANKDSIPSTKGMLDTK